MAYTFDPIFAADPNNPETAAANASITLFDPADVSQAAVTITDVTGAPLANPITVNKNGFGPAFQHATLDRLGWTGGGFTGYFTSFEGIKAAAVAAQAAAEAAGADAAAAASADLATAVADAEAAQAAAATSATAAANSAALVNAPADTAVETLINGTGTATRAALNATYGKTVKVHKYGTNAAAFEAAAAEAGAGGTIMAEKWAGPYTIASPVTLTEVSLISDGATINVTALGSGVSALTFTSTGPRPDMWAEGFWLKGPGTRSLGVKNANVDGIQIAGSAMPKFRNVRVDNFDSGFVLNNGAGHIYWDHCNVTNNYYGVYCKLNSFDYFFKDCKINGNTFANFAAPADQGFEALVIRDSHIGFAPYGIYQEPTPINQGKPKLFLQEVILDHCRFEQIGNAAIFTEAQQDATNASITSNLRIIHPGFSWSPESGAGSYKIASRDRNYAVVLSQTDRVIEIEQGANAFSAGTLGTIRVKLAGHAAFILRGASGQAFAGQVTTDSGSANVYAFAAPVVPGTAQSFPQLDITGNGYIRWNGTTVRYGGDTTSQFADIAANGVWRIRNAGNGYAAAFDVTPTQALLPAGSTLRTGRAVTGSRPSASTAGAGAMFYDTTLSKPIYSDGTVWRDAAGTAV